MEHLKRCSVFGSAVPLSTVSASCGFGSCVCGRMCTNDSQSNSTEMESGISMGVCMSEVFLVYTSTGPQACAADSFEAYVASFRLSVESRKR